MPKHQKPNTRRIEFLLSNEAYERFHQLHEARGLRSKTETLEALFYVAELDGKCDPNMSERLELKVDRLIEMIEELT